MVSTQHEEEIVSRDLAAQFRPCLGDPTRLENGRFHPCYLTWLVRPGEQTNPWLHVTFPALAERLPHTADDYLDSDAVREALGPRWRDVIQGRHLGARPPTWERLAALVDLPVDEVLGHVENARVAHREHERMLSDCRTMPFKLQSWKQMQEREPCPGCGHAWLEADSPNSQESFAIQHADCAAGGTAVRDGRRHCNRCCGYPPISPETRAKVNALLERAAKEQDERERAERSAKRSESNRTNRRKRREAEIARLEAQLERLREDLQRDADPIG